MPTSGSNLHSMVFSISVLGEKFNANIEKHKTLMGIIHQWYLLIKVQVWKSQTRG